MKHKIAVGQIYVDDDGDAFQVVEISQTQLTLRSADGEWLFLTPDNIVQDIESGEFELLDEDEYGAGDR